MVRRALAWVASRLLSPPRVIFDQDGKDPYLSRYYLVGGPRMPDGSAPFDQYGDPKRGAIWPKQRFGLFLHRFHRGDHDRELHSHPWHWAVSWILAGGYREERRTGNIVVIRDFKPGNWNFLEANDFHRVDLLEDDCWTLFIVGPKAGTWHFWDRLTGKLTPWRDFVNARRDPTAFARENKWDITPEQRRAVFVGGDVKNVRVRGFR